MIAPTYVVSSNIEAAGYALGKLYVLFKTGVAYMYSPVSYTMFDAMVKQESVGSWFHKNIKTNKDIHYQKLEANPFKS